MCLTMPQLQRIMAARELDELPGAIKPLIVDAVLEVIWPTKRLVGTALRFTYKLTQNPLIKRQLKSRCTVVNWIKGTSTDTQQLAQPHHRSRPITYRIIRINRYACSINDSLTARCQCLLLDVSNIGICSASCR